MKKLITSAVCLLLLTGCFGGGGGGDVGNEVVVVNKPPVSLSVPKAWREIKESDLSAMSKDTVLAYSSLNYTNGFASNISITKEALDKEYSSEQYATANMVNSAKFLEDYTKLGEKEITVKEDDNTDVKTKMHTFEARFDRLEKKRKYIQLYLVKNKIGYTVTVTVALEEQDLSKFENLVTSVHFVKE